MAAQRLRDCVASRCPGQKFFFQRMIGDDPHIILQHSWQDVAKISCEEEASLPIILFDYAKMDTLKVAVDDVKEDFKNKMAN
eukprot:7446923-Karenia_brevis.AAC.1